MRGDCRQVQGFIDIEDLLNAILTSESQPFVFFDVANDDSVNRLRMSEIVKKVLNLDWLRVKPLRIWQGDVDYCVLDSFKLKEIGWNTMFNSKQVVERATKELAE
jgi:nucleoside-diphosphate-sugar epimerase